MSPKQANKNEELQVSFLPEKKTAAEENPWQKRVLLLLFLMVMLLLLLGGFFRIAALRMGAHTAQERTVLTQLHGRVAQAEAESKDTVNLGRVIGFAKSALAIHTVGDRTLAIIESSAIPEVTLIQLAVDAKGTVVLSAKGKDYDSVSRQLLSWHSEHLIKEAHVSGVAAKLDALNNIVGIEFNATLTFMPEVLKFSP